MEEKDNFVRDLKRAEWRLDTAGDLVVQLIQYGPMWEFHPDQVLNNCTAEAMSSEDNECPICLIEYDHKYDPATGREPALKLTCQGGHVFGSECIRAWFWSSRSDKCPMCRGIGIDKNSLPRTLGGGGLGEYVRHEKFRAAWQSGWNIPQQNAQETIANYWEIEEWMYTLREVMEKLCFHAWLYNLRDL